LDQNEKLTRFGITHIGAIDGYSRKIVGFITIPRKNAIAIYNVLFRPLLINEGLWEQVRTDHGGEFALIAAIQLELQSLRHPVCNCRPVVHSMSTQNHRVERLWPEVNQRINYPVKMILVMMESSGELDLTNNRDKFAVSWVTIKVISQATTDFVQAWNHHRISGSTGGIPVNLASNNRSLTRISQRAVPHTDQAIRLFTQNGGHLTQESTFGRDMLHEYPNLQALRERLLHEIFINEHDLCKCTP
jgi:hypothetical protein